MKDDNLYEKAMKAAEDAKEKAYCPYSHFKVGAAVITKEGNIYSGCNVENSSYGATICAERNAITTAVREEGDTEILSIFVSTDDDPPSPPCAICLQVIAEFAKSDTKIVLFSSNSKKEYLFKDFLPLPFSLKGKG